MFRLDKAAEQFKTPDGRTINKGVIPVAPKKCFCTFDLYTIFFGAQLNDDIERHLFGDIDYRGAIAVRAFSGGKFEEIHPAFQDFFEYLDAQKLRTPKGLDWIRAKYRSLTQAQLMVEMQGLRTMHCTMWAEGVREIVSAENSDVKFIMSDHPVTIYNAACAPDSPSYRYPDDPAIDQVGSQTVFVLDPDHCLILTNLEYATSPKEVDLTAPRTNARYRGSGLVSTEAFIRTRKLSRSEVLAINYLLKSRATRFVAAGTRQELFPEQHFHGSWRDIGDVLLPRDELWRFGGEIYVRYKDGTTHYQDPFGRTSRAHEYLRKEAPAATIGPEDWCGCGSGRRFRMCCQDVPPIDRPSWDVYGIRERNLMFAWRVEDILGLKDGKAWIDVRRELNAEHVVEIHRAFESLWPTDTDLPALLPRPDKNVTRVVYLGIPDPRTIGLRVLGWLPYFDEIVVPHPFQNPARLKPEFCPVRSPSKHREQTLKDVMLLLMLAPFIYSGRVHLIPDMSEFNYDFGSSVMKTAAARVKAGKPIISDEDRRQFEVLMRDDLRRAMLRMPEESHRASLKRHSPNIQPAEMDAALAELQRELVADDLALLQPTVPGDGGQFHAIKSYTLESALFLATTMEAGVYSDTDAHWGQLHQHAVLKPPAVTRDDCADLVDVVGSVDLPFNYEVADVARVLEAGTLEKGRDAIRRVVAVVSGRVAQADVISAAAAAAEALRESHQVLDRGGADELRATMELSVPTSGFERLEVTRLLLTFGRAKVAQSVPWAMRVRVARKEES